MSEREGRLKKMFRAEGRGMLNKLGRVLEDLDAGTADAEAVDRAFRYAHSLKSEAAFLEYADLAASSHELEERLSAMRRGEPAPGGLVELLIGIEAKFEAAAERISAGAGAERPEQAEADERRRISEEPVGLADGIDAQGRRQLREARARNEHLYHVLCRLTSEPEARYPRAFLILSNLEMRSNLIAVAPEIEALADREDGAVEMLVAASGGAAQIREALQVDEVEDVRVVEETYERYLGAAQDHYRPSIWHDDLVLHMKTRSYEELCLFADELWLNTRESADGRLRFLSDHLRERVGATATVELVDLLGELPVRVQSIAAERGKRVRLEVAGGSGPVYVPVADLLIEALMHLVRNAVEHGIEAEDARGAAGKKPEGVITVTVEREQMALRLSVTDDGTGVDEIDVRRASADTGSLLDVLARPGFTTAVRPTRESGHGVGLDAVVHSVRDVLGGSVQLDNRAGRSFSVVLTVPNVGRMYSVVLVGSLARPYAIPAASVVDYGVLDSRRLRRDSLGHRYYEHDGQRMELFALEDNEPVGEAGMVIVLIVGERRAALLAPEVLGEETVVRDLTRPETVYSTTVNREARFVLPFDLVPGI